MRWPIAWNVDVDKGSRVKMTGLKPQFYHFYEILGELFNHWEHYLFGFFKFRLQ